MGGFLNSQLLQSGMIERPFLNLVATKLFVSVESLEQIIEVATTSWTWSLRSFENLIVTHHSTSKINVSCYLRQKSFHTKISHTIQSSTIEIPRGVSDENGNSWFIVSSAASMTQSNNPTFVSMRTYRSKVLIPYDVGCLHGPVFGRSLMLNCQFYESMRTCVTTARSEEPDEEMQDRARSGARMVRIISTQILKWRYLLSSVGRASDCNGKPVHLTVRTRQVGYIFHSTSSNRNLFRYYAAWADKYTTSVKWICMVK